jgi:RNA polymerase sigma factor (sigma-70 family)
MARTRPGVVLAHVRRIAAAAAAATDGELLARFAAGRDETAFTALVQRHGPMVLGVCRGVLRHTHDAEDAFQAAFLILARKAATIRRHQSVGGWLHEVAYRVALKARARSARRFPEGRAEEAAAGDPVLDLTLRDVQRVVHEELRRLPEKYRAPLVLCYLEARTQDEAARQLGCTEPALRGRLYRGRQLLRERLTRRGLTLGAGLLPALVSADLAAAVPPALVRAITRAEAPAVVAELAAGVLRSAALTRLRNVALALLALAVVATAAGVLVGHSSTAPEQGEKREAAPAPRPKGPQIDGADDPLPAGALARLGTLRFRHGGDIGVLDAAPDGKMLVTGGRWPISYGSIRLWDAEGRLLRSFPGVGRQDALAFSPDGRVVAAGGEHGGVHRWEAATGKELPHLKADGVPNSGAIACTLAFAADGKTLVAAFRGSMIRAWDLTTNKPLPQFAGEHGYAIQAIALSPDGKLLASGGYDHDKNNIYFFRLWDVATGKEVRRLRGYNGGVTTLTFSPVPMEGGGPPRWLLATGGGGMVRLWETATGQQLRQFEGGGKSEVLSVTFSPDGKRLAAGGDVVRVWDTGTWGVVQTFPQQVRRLAFLGDGNTLAVASGAVVRLLDVKTGKERRPSGAPESQLSSAAWSPDGRTVATGVWYGTTRLWDAATGKALHHVGVTLPGNVAFSPDGKFLAAPCLGGKRLRLWDVATGQDVGPFQGNDGQPTYLTFTPDGKAILTVDAGDGSVRAWDRVTGTGRLVSKIEKGGPGSPQYTRVFSPDARLLAAAEPRLDRTTGLNGISTVYLYDVATGKRLHVKKVTGNHIQSVAFSPDGKLLAAAAQGFGRTTYVWDTATGKEVWKLPLSVDALTFSADGRLLATSEGGGIRLWEVATYKQCGGFGGHREAVLSLAFSPDCRSLLSGSVDTTALIWDVTGLRSAGRPPAALTAGEVEALWAALAGEDAEAAWRAIRKLTAAPGASVPLLQKHLRPVPRPDERRLAELINDLGSDKFAVRQQATRELESLQEVAGPALRKTLEGQPALEARRRIEQLLAKLDGRAVTPEDWRTLRALTALEHARTAAARRLLEALAEGASGARLTREARQALDRLRRSDARN